MNTSIRASRSARHSPGLAGIADVLLFAFLGCYLAWSLVHAVSETPKSLVVELILALNGVLALIGLSRSTARGYPLFVVFFFFNFLFHALAPLQQIAEQKSPIFDDAEVLLLASCLCVPFTVFGLFFVFRRRNDFGKPHGKPGLLDLTLFRFRPRDTTILLVVTATIAGGLLIYYLPILFTNRQAASQALSGDASKTAVILLHAFVDPLAFVGALIGLILNYRHSNHGRVFIFGLLTVLAALVNNPLIHARYQSSALIVFGLLAIYGWNKTRLILYPILAGIAVSPIFNSFFRYNSVTNDTRDLRNFFAHMDYDALNIFCYTVVWVRERGIEYGSNLFGAFFFFIPRSLWSEKGEHPAKIIFDYLHQYEGYTSDNLSSPPPVEGYLAFGLLGALALSLVVPWAFDMIERRAARAQTFSAWQLISSILVMLAMIFLRGPLQVGFAEAVMRFFTIVTVTLLLQLGAVARSSAVPRKSR
ncbi:hypothetical protein [Bradyrhizobium sp. 25ACV]